MIVKHPDRAVIFKEDFKDIYSVQKNGGTVSGDVTIQNGVASFPESYGYVTYNANNVLINCTFHLRIKFNDLTVISNQHVFDIQNQSISCYIRPDGLLSTNADLVYINGVISALFYPIVGVWYDMCLVRVGLYPISVKTIMVGNWSAVQSIYGMRGSIDLMEIYNRSLSLAEVQCLYNGNLYTDPSSELPMLLDYSSERGVIEDLTGKNTLVPSYITNSRVGKTYSADSNRNTQAIIATSGNVLKTDLQIISTWVRIGDSNKNYGLIWNSSFVGGEYVNVYWNTNSKQQLSFQVKTDGYTQGVCGLPYFDGVKEFPTQRFVNVIVWIKNDQLKICMDGYINPNTIQLTNSQPICGSNRNFTLFSEPAFGAEAAKNITRCQVFDGSSLDDNSFAKFAVRIYNSEKSKYL